MVHRRKAVGHLSFSGFAPLPPSFTVRLATIPDMKKLNTFLLALLSLGLAIALFAEVSANKKLRAQLASRQQEMVAQKSETEARIAKVEEQNEIFKSESEQLRHKLGEQKKEVAAPGAVAADPAKSVAGADAEKKPDGNWLKGIAKMFNDPEMKKSMRAQQAFGIRMMYADLAKELGLSSQDANLVFDLLADRQMDMSAKALGNDGDASKLEANAADAQKTKSDYDAEIKNILGEERMKKFEDFERTVGERMMLQQYQQSLSGSGTPMDEGQRKALLGIMTEERLRQPATPLEAGSKDVSGAMKALRTGEGFDKAMASQRDINQRVLSRARTLLSADQIVSFETAQKQMLDMQEMGMKMGKAMMGGGEGKK
jgi:hypothetical protein